jgi:hypothetical protein
MIKVDAINLAKKALQDIGHWEGFNLEKANYIERLSPYGYKRWIVSFNFTEDDWSRGEITPLVIVNDEEEIVTFVSWKKSEFLLQYNKVKDKYFHPNLSR